MASSINTQEVLWVSPQQRGIIPLTKVHLSRRLKRTIRQKPFTITCDTDFPRVMEHCRSLKAGRQDSWINNAIMEVYNELHRQGIAHCIACYHESAKHRQLVGGLYGVHLGGVFFGESMFSLKKDASKIALAYLIARLNAGGFKLLDIQFLTKHLQQFGAVEIAQKDFDILLQKSLATQANFHSLDSNAGCETVLQLCGHMS